MDPSLKELFDVCGDSDVFRRLKQENDEWRARVHTAIEQTKSTKKRDEELAKFAEHMRREAERFSKENGSLSVDDYLSINVNSQTASALADLSSSGTPSSQVKRLLPPPSHDPPPPPVKRLRVLEPTHQTTFFISRVKRVFANKEEKLNGHTFNVDKNNLEPYFFHVRSKIFKTYVDIADALGDYALEGEVRKVLQNDKDHDLMLKRRLLKLIQCIEETPELSKQ